MKCQIQCFYCATPMLTLQNRYTKSPLDARRNGWSTAKAVNCLIHPFLLAALVSLSTPATPKRTASLSTPAAPQRMASLSTPFSRRIPICPRKPCTCRPQPVDRASRSRKGSRTSTPMARRRRRSRPSIAERRRSRKQRKPRARARAIKGRRGSSGSRARALGC